MKKDFKTIYSSCGVDKFIITNISKQQQQYIKHQLTSELVRYILNNIDNLPLQYTIKDVKNIQYNPLETHKIKINLISDEEINRLKRIESEYYNLMKYQNK